jgi:TRAP-type uncharacterized transport system substrate-binding protein
MSLGTALALAPTAADAAYRLGAGARGGSFAALGEAITAETAGTRAPQQVEYTKGSCENIRRLLEGTLDFALVQYDVAAEAYRASLSDVPEGDDGAFGGWMCKISPALARHAELRVVTAVSDSAVHMLVRRPVRLDDFGVIGDQQVFIGKDGSGSFETAKVILGAGGQPVEHLRLFGGGADEALHAMGRRELLMMLRTTDPGHAEVTAVLDSGLATINPLPELVLNRLIDGYPYYRVCPLEPRHYPGRLEYSMATVCVSSVVLAALPRAQWEDRAARATQDVAVEELLTALGRLASNRAHRQLGLDLRYRDFAEKEPIPLHAVAAAREVRERWMGWMWTGAAALALLLALLLVRRALRRRGVGFGVGFEGQLSNPLVPFAAFALVVMLSTYLVWFLEHDSNTRLRTLRDSFWEMNTFATGNFSAETLKTSGARLVGALATVLGLGLLAWFTAALTNIFAQDQTRLWRRLRGHLVVLNFREDMLPLIRLLRSPGPSRLRSLHVVVPDALPKRVRLQLARVKALAIHYENPEVPENLAALRLPRAARVIVLGGEPAAKSSTYDPLRIARAVHQACARDPDSLQSRALAGGPSPAMSTISVASPAMDRVQPLLPVTLVEASADEPGEIFDPFAAWLLPIDNRALAHAWLATACRDPAFAEFFSGVVAFSDANAEVYTLALPPWAHGQPWRAVRRALLGHAGAGRGVIPLGLYRASASDGGARPPDIHADLRTRLLINPAPTTAVAAGDFVVALCEDEPALRQALRAARLPPRQ